MKRFLLYSFVLIAVFALALRHCHAATVYFPVTNWTATTLTNRVKVTPVGDTPTIDGQYIVAGVSKWLSPTNGNCTNSMLVGNYRMDIDGIGYPLPLYFAAPSGSGTYNVTNLLISGGRFFEYTPRLIVGISDAAYLTNWALIPTSALSGITANAAALTNGETRVVLLKNTLQLGSGTNAPNGELDLQASDGSAYSLIARTTGLGLLLDQTGIKVADAVIEASGNGYFKGNGAGLNNITGIPGTIFTNGQDLVAGAAATPTYTLLSLMPGTYNYTNTIQLKEGQLLVGSGRGNTFLKFWGYSSNSTQPVGDDWVGISLQTNILIKALDIRNMVSNVNSFQASIGRRTNAGAGATGFKIEDVSMHGDTDNFYIDNSGLYQGDLINCYFDGHWDVAVHTALTENSWLNFWNPTVTVAGYSTSKGASQPANPFRFGVSGAGTNRAIRIFGGNVSVTNGVVANAGGAPVSIYGLRYNNNGWGTNFQGVFNFYDMDVDYSKIRSITLNQEGLAIGAHDVQPQGAGLEENAYFGNPPAGTAYYNTNTYAWRVFDGLSWKSVLAAMNTNTLLVSGASDSSYNGIYTWKQGSLGTSFGAFTNAGGKFLVGSTNTTADAVYALSSTLSISNGLEYVINTTPQLERGWDLLDSEDNPVNIRVSLVYSNYFDGNGAAITNLPASAIWSGTLAAARMPALTGVITTVAGAIATSFGSFASSALATALTDETGSGGIVLSNAPTLNNLTVSSSLTNSGVGATKVVVTDSGGKEIGATLSGLTLVAGTLTATGGGDPQNYWATNGNSGLPTGSQLGNTDQKGFNIVVNNQRVLGFDSLTSASHSGNLTFGINHLITTNSGTFGNVILGGDLGNGITNGVGNILLGGSVNHTGTGASQYAAILGGSGNYVNAIASVIVGGTASTITGSGAANGIILGGNGNTISGASLQNCIAAGQHSIAAHGDSFIWSDSSSGTFSTTNANTFNIRASGGFIVVGAQTNSSDLKVDGNLAVTGTATFSGGATVGTLTASGISFGTNLFSGTLFPIGTNYNITTSANLGFTGVANIPTTTYGVGELMVKSTGTVVVTNPASWFASDGLTNRTITNGNFAEMSIKVTPGLVTNFMFIQTYHP